jgi:serine/threonine protein phosphatase PrpC
MNPPSSSPSVVFGCRTDAGRRRPNNEDSFWAGLIETPNPGSNTLLIVSDGVGGASAGEVASRMAVDGAREILTQYVASRFPLNDHRSCIDATIREIDQRIRIASRRDGFGGMGATLSLLWITDGMGWWGQAGDSRIYLLRKSVLRQLSRDQSPVGRLRADGALTEEQARVHPYRHLIDQCLGTEGESVEPEIDSIMIETGDVFLLCSDGLNEGLWDREISDGLLPVTVGLSPSEAAHRLVQRAKEASGRDNITALVAFFASSPPGHDA